MARSYWIGMVALMAGCQDDGVRVLHVSKPPAKSTIAVIAPLPDATWFIKLTGPAMAVTADAEPFRDFFGSVQFPKGDVPIRYDLPDGWKTDSTNPAAGGPVARTATIRTGRQNEVIVTRLGPEAAAVLPNVNRWRAELGLGPVEASDLASITKQLQIGGSTATWVDVGAGGAKLSAAVATVILPEKQTAPQMESKTEPAIPSTKIEFTAPADWVALPADGMRYAAWRLGSELEGALVTIIPMAGNVGGVAANVNRWRTEIGLKPLSDDQALAEVKTMQVADRPGSMVELLGPESAERQRSIAVIIPQGSTTWFVKLRGRAQVVEQHRQAFEQFVRGIKLPGGR